MIDNETKEFLEKFETRIDTLEQIVSQLMVGYMDIAVAVEATMQDALSKMDTEQKAEFVKDSFTLRKQMIDILQTAASEEGLGFNFDSDTKLSHAMESSLPEDKPSV